MPALRATSLRLSAACSRPKARMTASPLASPPMASRRAGVILRRGMWRSLFRYPKKRKGAAATLDAAPRGSPLSFRITTSSSDSEKTASCEQQRSAVKIGRQDQRSSAISTPNAETILVRGRDLTRELIGTLSFTEHFWLLLTGAVPSPAQRRILDATLVAIAEHGMVPSVQAARLTLAAAPESLQGAVAAGLLGCGSVVLGSSQAAGRFFAEIAARAAAAPGPEAAATQLLNEYRGAGRAIPGYGHPLHKGNDPRARRLFEVAAEAGLARPHVGISPAGETPPPPRLPPPLVLHVSAAT